QESGGGIRRFTGFEAGTDCDRQGAARRELVAEEERPEACGSAGCAGRRVEADLAGYYPGVAEDRKLAVGRIIPGNHESTQRGCHPWQDRHAERFERKRNCRTPDPGWNGSA